MPPAVLPCYFENSVGRLLEHPLGYAVVAYRPGPRPLASLQELLGQLARLLTQRRWGKVLVDQRHMQPFTLEESAWIRAHWLTRTISFHGAIVLSHNVFARLASSQLVLEAKAARLSYRLFDELAAAEAWLHQLP